MYSKKPYMVHVNPPREAREVAAEIVWAKSKLKDVIKHKDPHVPINSRKRKTPVSFEGTTQRVTPPKKKAVQTLGLPKIVFD